MKAKHIRRADEIRAFILENIKGHPADIVTVAAIQFAVSRPAVHVHLKQFINDGQITKVGTTRSTRYQLVTNQTQNWTFKVTPDLHEDEIWEKNIASKIGETNKNIQSICFYGFTEIFNNVLDHSEANTVQVSFRIEKGKIKIAIKDDGVGILKKIQDAMNLPDIRESILHLSKGKLTTDPSRHTGEGIFFTSRAFDQFWIDSGDLTYTRVNREQDWFLHSNGGQPVKGTTVKMEIDQNSERILENVFKEYTNAETFSFDRTNIMVKMARLKGEKYVSRSQAKRILLGLEKFKKIILDFKDVDMVGQAFVDEVFRVFKVKFLNIEITPINMNADVQFMIQRGLAAAAEINAPR